MEEISATEASRRFSELLDAVERGESFTVRRNGKPVARITPSGGATGATVRGVVRTNPADDAWGAELAELRGSLIPEERSWPA